MGHGSIGAGRPVGFEEITFPVGTSIVRFAYLPRHEQAARAVAMIALATVVASLLPTRTRHRQRAR